MTHITVTLSTILNTGVIEENNKTNQESTMANTSNPKSITCEIRTREKAICGEKKGKYMATKCSNHNLGNKDKDIQMQDK